MGDVISGELGDEGVPQILRDLELRRVTGVLRFASADGAVTGAVQLYGGEIAVEQEARPDGADPVDLLLELRDGSWEVAPELPPLPVSKGDPRRRMGSLAVHVPADLMGYCEGAGLTGVLELTRGERRAVAFYEAGELVAIELDGRDDQALTEVFGWDSGRFEIRMDEAAPREVLDSTEGVSLDSDEGVRPAQQDEVAPEAPAFAPRGEETARFLHIVEVALTEVVTRSERARSPTRTSPPLPPPPERRARPVSFPAPPRRRRRDEATVRLIYTGDEVQRVDPSLDTRHVRGRKAITANLPSATRGTGGTGGTEEAEEAMAKRRKRKKKGKRKAARAAPPSRGREAAAAPPRDRATTRREAGASPGRGKEGAAAGDAAPMWRAALSTAGWVGAAVAVGLAILAFLAALPPVE